MTKTTLLFALALPLLVAGCQNEPEQAPDITEAIPIDADSAAEEEDGPVEGAGPSGDESNTGADSTPLPGEPDTPPLPSTMESGANPPGLTVPPEGGKVQPAS